MTTEYTIDFRGHEWTTPCSETAQYFSQRGAEVTAQMYEGSGINLNRLSGEQLADMEFIARQQEWDEILHSIRDAQQLEVDQ